MRAFVVTGPGRAEVQDVAPPEATPGLVVVTVERAGVCGTDAELFSGQMAYLETGEARYPLRLGHEWCGRVSAVGAGVDPAWLGRRVTGDTMLGCGHCRRCTSGRQHLCAERHEIGVRNGWPGALAEQLPVPASALVALPDSVDAVLGALVEPAGNALRSVSAAALTPDARVLVLGPGTIGLLVAQIARAEGAEVHLLGRDDGFVAYASSLGFDRLWTSATLDRGLAFDAVVDASNDARLPALAVELVEPGGHVVLVGLSGRESLLDSRSVVLKDVTVRGVLSASGGLRGAVELFADGRVDPRPLVAATVGLEEVADVLAGTRPTGSGPGPKVHVDPRR